MPRELMFTALEYMFNVCELVFNARKHNFSRHKDKSFCRFHKIMLQHQSTLQQMIHSAASLAIYNDVTYRYSMCHQ